MTLPGVTAVAIFCVFIFFRGHACKQIKDFESVYPSNVSLGDKRIPLTIALMMSFSGEYVTYNSISGIQLALDLINENSSLLPGYRLQYKLTDSQVSPDSSSPVLEDRNMFKMYFQMLPNEVMLPPVFEALFNTFGWKRLYSIAQDSELFTLVLDGTKKILPSDSDISSIIYSKVSSSPSGLDNFIKRKTLFDDDSRIIELAMYQPDALKVICEAYNLKKYAPKYVLILRDWYGPQWWNPAGYNLNCTIEQMETALSGSLAVALNVEILDNDKITQSGLSFNQYQTEYARRAVELGLDPDRDDTSYFDSFWALALALNKTLQDIGSSPFFANGTSNSFQNMATPLFSAANNTVSNDSILKRIFQHVSNTSFTGITGDVTFNQNGIRRSYVIDVEQYRINSTTKELYLKSIGYVLPNGTFILLDGENTTTIFPYGVPHDGSSLNVTRSIEVGLTAAMHVLASLGIIFTAVCLGFVVVFRHKRLVQLSSPVLCYIICAGCLLLYISVFFLAIQSKETVSATVICNLRVWLWTVGYSLAFGPILGKVFRIYFIFQYRQAKKLQIKDWMIVVAVGVLVGVDIILLLIASVVPQLRINAEVQSSSEYPSTNEGDLFQVQITNNILECQSLPKKGYVVWQSIMLGYKGFIQVLSIPLAFGAKKVSIKGLNDSKYTIAIVYITSVCLAVIIACFATLNSSGTVNTLAAVYSVGFWISASVILLLVFVPKMYALHSDPCDDDVASSEHNKHSRTSLEEQAKKLELELVALTEQKQHLRALSVSQVSSSPSKDVDLSILRSSPS